MQTVQVPVTNTTGQAATLVGYLDWNLNGTFDAGEASNAVAVPAGHDQPVPQLEHQPSPTSGLSFVRLRVSLGGAAGLIGTVYGGEVEDHPVNIGNPAVVPGDQEVDATSNGPVQPGQDITYTINVTNPGPVPAPASFSDDLADVLDDADLIAGPTNGAAINGTLLSWSGTVPQARPSPCSTRCG